MAYPDLTKKTVIVAGYSCNNNCIFCINWDKRGKFLDQTSAEIKREIAKAKNRGSTYIEIIGGEGAIRPDILELIKYAKDLGFQTIMMATNGRMYAYKDFARAVLMAGLNSLVFSIHGDNGKLHDSLTQVPGSFKQLTEGVRNIQALIKELKLNVSLGSNTCITKQNYKFLPRIGRLIRELRIDNAEFIFIDPNQGAGLDFFDKLVPRFSETAPYIHKCLDIGKRDKVPHWHIRYVPLCYFQDYLDQISELHEVRTFHTEHIAPDFYDPDASSGRKNVGRVKTTKCKGCRFFNECEGIWKEYFKHYGDTELTPVKD